MISVLIADDQGLIRKGLRMLLEAEPDLRVAGETLTRASRQNPEFRARTGPFMIAGAFLVIFAGP